MTRIQRLCQANFCRAAAWLTRSRGKRHLGGMPSAVTQGIRITVESAYLPERSSPAGGRYAFSYKVRIENIGTKTAQLKSRHWIITHGDGRTEEVRGDGVVGAQPT